MEQKVYRIWTHLSAFEESSAACISDMLRHVSASNYLDAIRMAEKFILHVEVLFAAIDDLEVYFAQVKNKGMFSLTDLPCMSTVLIQPWQGCHMFGKRGCYAERLLISSRCCPIRARQEQQNEWA